MNNKAEMTLQSMITALTLFAVIFTGFTYVFYSSATTYSISDSTDIDISGFDTIKAETNTLINSTENEDTTLPPGDDPSDSSWLGSITVFNKLKEARLMFETMRNATATAFNFVSEWIWISLFSIIFLAFLMRG